MRVGEESTGLFLYDTVIYTLAEGTRYQFGCAHQRP